MSGNHPLTKMINNVFLFDIQKSGLDSTDLSVLLNSLLQIYCSNPYLAKAENRHSTFNRKWQLMKCQNSLEIDTVVREGFYYTGVDDETICVGCDLGMKGWTAEDCPKTLHSTHSPKCPFVICLGLFETVGSNSVPVNNGGNACCDMDSSLNVNLNLVYKFVKDKSGYAVDNARGLGHTDNLICLGSYRYLRENGNLPNDTISLLRSIMVLDDQLESHNMLESDLPAIMELLELAMYQ